MNASLPPSLSPSLSPSLPPLEAISCPPSAPPPAPPPDFSVWSQSVPLWFWAAFLLITLFAVCGVAGMGYILYLMRQDRRRGGGLRIPDGTRAALGTIAAKRRLDVDAYIEAVEL